MILGPVFHAELITTARRARYYVIRALYGLMILFQIYLIYQANRWRFASGRSDLLIHQMAEFGAQIFQSFAILQAVVVVLLTPALVGGTIADERQRKTLHYLLTSRLGGLEIVVGKLAARLLHVSVLIALGLPVVSLIGLFGGIDFGVLLLTYAGTLTTVYFLATLSILVSVHSRRPREAISVLYIYVMVWLIVPTLLIATMKDWPDPWPAIHEWVQPWLQYVALTSPIYLLDRRSVGGPPGLMGTALWGMGLQLLYGTIFVAIAAARLRPASREEGGRRGIGLKIAGLSRKRSWFPRPECGDDAMLWKERYVARTGGMTKAVMVAVAVALIAIVGYSMIDFVGPAFRELRRDGYFQVGQARRDLNHFLRIVSTAIFVLWSLGVASAAASGMSSEREEDTWISLISTPLPGDEIVRAKMIGPVWGLRTLAYLMFALWAIGLSMGSVHPLALVACAIELVVFTWFLTALGTTFSLRSKNSTRALALTMVTLIFINGGYMFCCIPLRPDTPAIAAGSTPFVFAVSLFCEEDLRNLSGRDTGEVIVASILSVFGYGIVAAGLTVSLFQSFEAAVDRPDRFRRDPTPAQQRERMKGQAKEIVFDEEYH